MNLEQKIEADLRQAEAEYAAMQARAEQAKWKVDYLRSLLGHTPASTKEATAQLPLLGTVIAGPVGSITSQMVEVIRKAGGPIHIKDIVQRMIAQGYGAPGIEYKKARANLASMLAKYVKTPNSPIMKAGVGFFQMRPESAGAA